jgi:hypothetical protein
MHQSSYDTRAANRYQSHVLLRNPGHDSVERRVEILEKRRSLSGKLQAVRVALGDERKRLGVMRLAQGL